MNPTFSILHPTARLPDGWRAACDSWLFNGDGEEYEYVLAIHALDWDQRPIDECIHFSRKVVRHDQRYCSTDGWNAAAAASSGKVLIFAADDFFPPPLWDTELLEAIPDLDSDFVVHVSTGSARDGELMTHPIISRRTYERWGYAYYPEYESMYADDDLTLRAYREGIIVDARHIVFEHRHPVNGTAPDDRVYRHQNRPQAYDLGKKIFERRKAEGFK